MRDRRKRVGREKIERKRQKNDVMRKGGTRDREEEIDRVRE